MSLEPLVTYSEFKTPKGFFTKVKVIRQHMGVALDRQAPAVARKLDTTIDAAEIASLYNWLRVYAGETVNQLKARGL